MKLKFCLPLIINKKADVIKKIRKNMKDFDYFEVWLDHVKDLDNRFINKLTKLLKNRLIIVLRRNDAKNMKMHFERRCEVIKLLDNRQVMLDLDIRQKKELKFINKNHLNISLIMSYHDFNKTPEDIIISKIIKQMTNEKPVIIKIATLCHSKNDALRLLTILLRLKQKNMKCIVLGIGQSGMITRIFGALWGNEIIYAPINEDDRSAPGQLTRDHLIQIFNLME